MAYTLNDDTRIHLTADDAMAIGRKVVDFARAEATAGFGDAPACNQCLGKVLVAAIGTLAEDTALGGKSGEMIGLAGTFLKAKAYIDDVAGLLAAEAIKAALKSADASDLMAILSGKAPADH